MVTLPWVFPLLLVAWLMAVPLSIWRPRGIGADASRSDSYRLLRQGALLQLLGYALLLVPSLDTGEPQYRLLLLVAALLGILLLTPQALGALALDLGNAALGVAGSFLSLLSGVGLTWLCFVNALGYLLSDDGSTWRGLLALLGALMAGAAALFSMEVYLAFRRPPGQREQE